VRGRWRCPVGQHNRSATKRLDSALCGVDGVELDTEDEAHRIVDSVDMDDVTNIAELPRDQLDLLLDVVHVDTVLVGSFFLPRPASLTTYNYLR